MFLFVMVKKNRKLSKSKKFNYFLTNFIDLSKRSIKFTPHGDGIGTYDIFQYQIINSTDTLDYLTIGEFSDNDQNHER